MEESEDEDFIRWADANSEQGLREHPERQPQHTDNRGEEERMQPMLVNRDMFNLEQSTTPEDIHFRHQMQHNAQQQHQRGMMIHHQNYYAPRFVNLQQQQEYPKSMKGLQYPLDQQCLAEEITRQSEQSQQRQMQTKNSPSTNLPKSPPRGRKGNAKGDVPLSPSQKSRSERKRTREKERRDGVNRQFVELTKTLKRLENENREGIESQGLRLPFVAPNNSANLIACALLHLKHLHEVSKRQHLELHRLRQELQTAKKVGEDTATKLKEIIFNYSMPQAGIAAAPNSSLVATALNTATQSPSMDKKKDSTSETNNGNTSNDTVIATGTSILPNHGVSSTTQAMNSIQPQRQVMMMVPVVFQMPPPQQTSVVPSSSQPMASQTPSQETPLQPRLEALSNTGTHDETTMCRQQQHQQRMGPPPNKQQKERIKQLRHHFLHRQSQPSDGSNILPQSSRKPSEGQLSTPETPVATRQQQHQQQEQRGGPASGLTAVALAAVLSDLRQGVHQASQQQQQQQDRSSTPREETETNSSSSSKPL